MFSQRKNVTLNRLSRRSAVSRAVVCTSTVLQLMLAASSTAAQQVNPPDIPVVVTIGEGRLKRAPDRAWVTISAESRAKTPNEAQKLNADAMSTVLQKLKGSGLAPEAIRTSAYDLHPEFDYVNNKQTLRGYVARNSVEVRVDELPKLGEILDLAVGAGATSVSGVRFDLRDRAAAEAIALRQAVQDARVQADAVAQAANMRVERVLRIEVQRAGGMPPPRPVMMARAGLEQGAAPPIAPGEMEVTATVTMTAVIR
jgi:uncharacterized protein YggE